MSITDRLSKEIDRASFLNPDTLETVPVKVLTDAQDYISTLEGLLAEGIAVSNAPITWKRRAQSALDQGESE